MASASSLAYFNSGDSSDRGLETIEIDPQYAEGLGLIMGDIVSLRYFMRFMGEASLHIKGGNWAFARFKFC